MQSEMWTARRLYLFTGWRIRAGCNARWVVGGRRRRKCARQGTKNVGVAKCRGSLGSFVGASWPLNLNQSGGWGPRADCNSRCAGYGFVGEYEREGCSPKRMEAASYARLCKTAVGEEAVAQYGPDLASRVGKGEGEWG